MPYQSESLMEALHPQTLLGPSRYGPETSTRAHGRTMPGTIRDGSRTMVIDPPEHGGDGGGSGGTEGHTGPVDSSNVGVLNLRGSGSGTGSNSEDDDRDPGHVHRRNRRTRVQWTEDVVDNEGLGRKSSKICCIYHKPRPFDESSDESSSSSDDASDSSIDSQDSTGQSSQSNRWSHDGRRPTRRAGKGRHARPCKHDHSDLAEPNAYERAPSRKGT